MIIILQRKGKRKRDEVLLLYRQTATSGVFRLICKQDKERAAFPTGVYIAYTSKGKRKRDAVLRRK